MKQDGSTDVIAMRPSVQNQLFVEGEFTRPSEVADGTPLTVNVPFTTASGLQVQVDITATPRQGAAVHPFGPTRVILDPGQFNVGAVSAPLALPLEDWVEAYTLLASVVPRDPALIPPEVLPQPLLLRMKQILPVSNGSPNRSHHCRPASPEGTLPGCALRPDMRADICFLTTVIGALCLSPPHRYRYRGRFSGCATLSRTLIWVSLQRPAALTSRVTARAAAQAAR